MTNTIETFTSAGGYYTNTQKEVVREYDGTGLSEECEELTDSFAIQLVKEDTITRSLLVWKQFVPTDYKSNRMPYISGLVLPHDNITSQFSACNYFIHSFDESDTIEHYLERKYTKSRREDNRSSGLPTVSNLSRKIDLSSRDSIRNGVKTISEAVISFKLLENDWDGFGAIPPSAEVAALSIALVYRLEDFIPQLRDFYPNPHGTISLEWHVHANRELVVEIGSKKISFFAERIDGGLDTGIYTSLDIATTKIQSILSER